MKKEFARTFLKIKISKCLDIKQIEQLCAMRPGGLVSSLRLCGAHTDCHCRSEKTSTLTVTCPVLSHGLKRTLQPRGPPQLLEALGPPPAAQLKRCGSLPGGTDEVKFSFPPALSLPTLMRQGSQSLPFPHTAQTCHVTCYEKITMEISHDRTLRAKPSALNPQMKRFCFFTVFLKANSSQYDRWGMM